MMLARRLQQLGTACGGLTIRSGSISNLTIARTVSSKSDIEDWSDFNNVVKELRNISREQGLEGAMPNTKLLKELGYGGLVMAIRKKHGGVVSVAAKMGTRKGDDVFDMHKKVSSRARRREKRQERINKHDFY